MDERGERRKKLARRALPELEIPHHERRFPPAAAMLERLGRWARAARLQQGFERDGRRVDLIAHDVGRAVRQHRHVATDQRHRRCQPVHLQITTPARQHVEEGTVTLRRHLDAPGRAQFGAEVNRTVQPDRRQDIRQDIHARLLHSLNGQTEKMNFVSLFVHNIGPTL